MGTLPTFQGATRFYGAIHPFVKSATSARTGREAGGKHRRALVPRGWSREAWAARGGRGGRLTLFYAEGLD